MYSLYMMVKYILYWMVIVFKDLGDVIHNSVSSTYHMIAIYKGIPYPIASLFTYIIPAMRSAW